MKHVFGEKCIEAVANMVKELMSNHQQEIDRAYIKEEGTLEVGVKVKLKQPKEGKSGVALEVDLSFIKEKVKDSLGEVVDEDQKELPFDKKDKDRGKK